MSLVGGCWWWRRGRGLEGEVMMEKIGSMCCDTGRGRRGCDVEMEGGNKVPVHSPLSVLFDHGGLERRHADLC